MMILFFIKDTKLYVTVVTLSEKKQLQMFERSMYWNEYNAKNENENTTNEYRYFLESKFIGVDRFFFFFLVYSKVDDAKRNTIQK